MNKQRKSKQAVFADKRQEREQRRLARKARKAARKKAQ